MINREKKNKPRVDWDMVEDTVCLLEGVVERWASYLERYENDEDNRTCAILERND